MKIETGATHSLKKGKEREKEDFPPKIYHLILWRDSISRPIAPVFSVAGKDDRP
jgi:hypothetical protein